MKTLKTTTERNINAKEALQKRFGVTTIRYSHGYRVGSYETFDPAAFSLKSLINLRNICNAIYNAALNGDFNPKFIVGNSGKIRYQNNSYTNESSVLYAPPSSVMAMVNAGLLDLVEEGRDESIRGWFIKEDDPSIKIYRKLHIRTNNIYKVKDNIPYRDMAAYINDLITEYMD